MRRGIFRRAQPSVKHPIPRGYLPTVETMDEIARHLGAPDHIGFLSIASESMKCAFKVACWHCDRAAELAQKIEGGD